MSDPVEAVLSSAELSDLALERYRAFGKAHGAVALRDALLLAHVGPVATGSAAVAIKHEVCGFGRSLGVAV